MRDMSLISRKHYAMTIEAVAFELGLSRETVRKTERDALAKLRRQFPIFLDILRSLSREDDHCREYASPVLRRKAMEQ